MHDKLHDVCVLLIDMARSNWGLLVPCFTTGLLGGAVYVQALMVMTTELHPKVQELSLSSVSMAFNLGTIIATVAGLFIQCGLFKVNDIDGAVVSC